VTRRRSAAPRLAAVTVQEALGRYLDTRQTSRGDPSPATKRLYRKWIETHLPDWLDRPLVSVTADDVLARYHRIAKTNPATANQVKVLRGLWLFTDLPDRTPTRQLKGQWKPIAPRTGIIRADDLPRFYEEGGLGSARDKAALRYQSSADNHLGSDELKVAEDRLTAAIRVTLPDEAKMDD
jgi:hypothetical protein